jgi:hypothetical protein
LTDDHQNKKNSGHKLKGLTFLEKMQALNEEDKRVNGGITYAQTKNTQPRDINTCATIFAVHMALLINNGAPKDLLEEMV